VGNRLEDLRPFLDFILPGYLGSAPEFREQYRVPIEVMRNKAADRAFRIGQKRNVFIRHFITRNSFEEKIDAMIASKRELADMTVASGESWIARMSHEELKELFDRK
jgi:SNF2 family DNA or RNA helicase